MNRIMKQGKMKWLVAASLVGALAMVVAELCFQEQVPVDSGRSDRTRVARDVDAAPVFSLQRVASSGLPNALRINAQILSGGQPAGEEAFRALQAMGVRTVISVDAMSPDLEQASKFGLRYVHLPHGYDGISRDQLATLAKAFRDLPGPIYVHCHHGQHRSPSATAAACRALGWLTAGQARSILEEAGTSPHYRGLFQAVESAEPFAMDFLDGLCVDFPPVAQLPPLAATMVQMENALDHLKLLGENGWRSLEMHPDLIAADEALILREHFTELIRTAPPQSEVDEFVALLRDGEIAAGKLESTLRAGGFRGARDALAVVAENCATCHVRFRDIPLAEKNQTVWP